MKTHDVLKRAGLDLEESEFATLLDDALRSLTTGSREDVPQRSLTKAEAAVLESGGADLSPREDGDPDPLAPMAARYGALLATSLSVPEAAARLGVDASRVRHRLADGSLFGIRLRSGWRLPSFQFDDDGVVAGIDVVVQAVPDDVHPVALWSWLEASSVDLVLSGRPVSPLRWLRSGGDPAVVAALAADL
jgi:hypothetical protein